MYEKEQNLIRSAQPSYFPNFWSTKLANWIDEVERMFKEPIKNVFPYPMNIIKTFDKETKNLRSLSFQVALAGISKDCIKVQLKKGKILTISVNPADNDLEDSEVVVNGICNRDAEVSFKIFFEVDVERFKPIFKDGLLSIELFVKEAAVDNDVITAEF